MPPKCPVTRTTLDAKLDKVIELQEKHERLLCGVDPPGVILKLDRLIQVDESRRWHFRFLWGSVVTTIIGLIATVAGVHFR